MRSNIEYRSFPVMCRSEPDQETYIVEGYASTFDPYVLFEYGGVRYMEEIDRSAFNDCDMADVVFRVDHEGLVYARSSAGTLSLMVDDHGLFNRADLSKTSDAKRLYEHIKAGDYLQMSFAFTVQEDSYDLDTHTRRILKIDRLYDVSPVSFPANPGTELNVSERSSHSSILEMEKRARDEKIKQALRKKLLAERLRKELR